MNIVFFAHPLLLGSQSMPRFVNMLMDGMKSRGCHVQLFRPKPYLSKLPVPSPLRKWLGYIDQYIFFPIVVKRRLKSCDAETLFVLTDHALGPWVPLVAHRPHVIHCHDFLAQKSFRGSVKENRTRWLGRQYQAYIYHGYSQGKNFISVSNKTKEDLHFFLQKKPCLSEVVYNGLNQKFGPCDPQHAKRLLGEKIGLALHDGYLLHVGGNQWYKNRAGVIEIYTAWRMISKKHLPLLMVGKKPDSKLKSVYDASSFKSDIHFVVNLNDALMPFAYAGADAFLFPSIAEGFGWPIAEAMAVGCPVITTNVAPMTEVGRNACYYIPARPFEKDQAVQWARQAALALDHVLRSSARERLKLIEEGFSNVARFNQNAALDTINNIYRKVLDTYRQGDENKTRYKKASRRNTRELKIPSKTKTAHLN